MNKTQVDFQVWNATTTSNRELYHLLTGIVAPRPIALVSSVAADGTVNISPFSFFNVFGSNPPTLIFSPVLRGSDGSSKDTLNNVKAVPEIVVHMVDFAMAEQMSLSSADFPPETNEIVKAGFTALPSARVQPPRIKEAPAAMECKVQDIIGLGSSGGAGNLVIAEVLQVHVRRDLVNADGTLDLLSMDHIGRMGGDLYCRPMHALFSLPKPDGPGRGVDALPESIRSSPYLSGRDLARLAALPEWPVQDKIDQLASVVEITEDLTGNPSDREASFCTLAKNALEAGDTEKALAILLYMDKLLI